MNPPLPSKKILEYGEPIPDGYGSVEQGQLIYDEGEVNCNFEAMYTTKGDIVVACRFTDFEELLRLFSIRETDGNYRGKDTFTNFGVLTGTTTDGMSTVTVLKGTERYANLSPVGGGAIFIAEELKIDTDAQPILASGGSIDSSADDFTCTNIASTIHRTFNIGSNKSIQLRGLPPLGEDQIGFYDPFAKLLISSDVLFDAWTSEDIATLWCALLSLAIGRDVRWIAKRKYNPERQVIEKRYVRHRNLVFDTRIKPFVEEPFFSHLSGSVPLVERAFEKVVAREISREAALDYAESIRHFVEYSLLTRSAEDQARLVCTAIEELLAKWERHSGKKAKATLTNMEASNLYKRVRPHVRQYITDEAIDAERDQDIRARISSFFGKDILYPSFEKRLEFLLCSFQNPDNHKWLDQATGERLSAFVRTRDKIVHEGKFPSELGVRGHTDIWEDYYNMTMMLPFMVFAILNYDGVYLDQYNIYKERKSSMQSSD